MIGLGIATSGGLYGAGNKPSGSIICGGIYRIPEEMFELFKIGSATWSWSVG